MSQDNRKYIFKQITPPRFYLNIKISHPENQIIDEHWKNVFTAIEVIKQNRQQQLEIVTNVYLLYKNKNGVTLMNFQNNCLIYQRNFKIIYSLSHEITCLKISENMLEVKNMQKRKEIILLIGYDDGSIEMYNLQLRQNLVSLKKLISFSSNAKQAVTDMAFKGMELYASRTHSACCYYECLKIVATILDIQTEKKQNRGKIDLNCLVKQFQIQQLISSGETLHLQVGLTNIYIFNEANGVKYFKERSMAQVGTIIDSVISLCQAFHQTIFISDSNDKIQIIYQKNNLIERYTSFKCYPSSIALLIYDNYEQVFVGDLNGKITYFKRQILLESNSSKESYLKKNESYQLRQFEAKSSVRLIENGIKHMALFSNMIIVLDSERNIIIFDIVRVKNIEK